MVTQEKWDQLIIEIWDVTSYSNDIKKTDCYLGKLK